MTTTAATATVADSETGSALVSPQRRNLIFVAVLLGMFLAALDQTIVATALPTVVADLGGAGHQSWVVTSYLLASTIVTAVVGKLGDLFGRKAVFQASVLFFLGGSVLCGLAGSMTMLVASRALQGISRITSPGAGPSGSTCRSRSSCWPSERWPSQLSRRPPGP
jgi:MFS family permease